MQLQTKIQKYALPVILIVVALAIGFYLFLHKPNTDLDTTDMATQSPAELAQASNIADQNKATIANEAARGPFVLVAETNGQKASELLNKYLKVDYKDYTMGAMVDGVNGIAGDGQNFWAFYVNGEFATKAVDRTILKAGDSIEIVYEQAEVHKGM